MNSAACGLSADDETKGTAGESPCIIMDWGTKDSCKNSLACGFNWVGANWNSRAWGLRMDPRAWFTPLPDGCSPRLLRFARTRPTGRAPAGWSDSSMLSTDSEIGSGTGPMGTRGTEPKRASLLTAEWKMASWVTIPSGVELKMASLLTCVCSESNAPRPPWGDQSIADFEPMPRSSFSSSAVRQWNWLCATPFTISTFSGGISIVSGTHMPASASQRSTFARVAPVCSSKCSSRSAAFALLSRFASALLFRVSGCASILPLSIWAAVFSGCIPGGTGLGASRSLKTWPGLRAPASSSAL
mmetsp:Transcript_62516/g.183266  ORF Transcript_62516/g.183266 Transcript_62516/m.183266 type:complete len:300 (-) Transcript_62516:1052-1951(-)